MSAGKFRGFAAALLLSVCLFVVAGLGEAQALKPRGAWSASVTYALDDIVILRGSTWRSKHNTNQGKLPGQTSPTSTAADWELFASGFNPLGTWKSTATYQKNDVVLAANGAVYRALRTNANKTPGLPANTADWAVFALRGATGAPGPQGVPGSTAVADGSTSAPAFKFTSSPDTGMFSPGGGKLALAENGSLLLHDIGSFNLGLGLGALGSSTGSSNTALGFNALFSNSTGNANTAVGGLAMQVNTTGNRNTAVGDLALNSNDVGNDNTAVGYQALLVNNASDNSAFGRDALLSNTDGTQNTAVGKEALKSNTSGGNNTAVGYGALRPNTLGFSNTAVGWQALGSNVGGDHNTAVGYLALGGMTDAPDNTAVGYNALAANHGGTNTAVGVDALKSNNTGTGNAAIGGSALLTNTTGNGNVAIGLDAGRGATNPSQSIFIRNIGSPDDTLTIKIGSGSQTSAFIGGIRGVTTGVADAVPVLIDSNLQLGTMSSSRRYKEDIHPMGAMSDMLARLRPVSFRYRKPYADGSKPLQYGLIAEEVAEAFPYLAVFNGEGQPETVKYHELPAFLLEGFQEQQKIIAAQADRIASLEARLAAIEAMLQQPTITAVSDAH